MLKIKFLEILNKILTKEYLKEEVRMLINIIIENEIQLPEEISTNILIEKLGLTDLSKVTDEKGYFKEIINTNNLENGEIESQTEIFYLLKGNQVSCLHSLDTTETWNWIGGKDISIYCFNKQGSVETITLNESYSEHTIEKNTLFGAKIANFIDENDFGIVTCLCKPGFVAEAHYSRPSSHDINILVKAHPQLKSIIEELTPIISKNKNNIIQSILQFFTCCIGVKQSEEETLLINSSRNRS